MQTLINAVYVELVLIPVKELEKANPFNRKLKAFVKQAHENKEVKRGAIDLRGKVDKRIY